MTRWATKALAMAPGLVVSTAVTLVIGPLLNPIAGSVLFFGGLLDKFKNAGHGQVVDSWVGKGPNQPVSPAQIQQSLGGTTIADLARQAGMSEDDLMAQLAQVMPDLVDKLTPQGRMPTAQEIRAGYRR